MCGIAGLCNLKSDWQQEIEKMNFCMQNRGPDGEGIWNDGTNIALGHRRLSILDISENGTQPMHSHDDRWIISFNGEIYNQLEIKQKLLAEKPILKFRGHSDTEVLLEAFSMWGVEKTLNRIYGMYAMALYDQYEKKLYLIRDPIGEKPLYYGYVNSSLCFSSDLRAIMGLDGFDSRIDSNAVALFLRLHYIPAPYTIFEKYKKLNPGEMLVSAYPFNKYELSKFYSIEQVALKAEPFEGSFEQAASKLEELLKKVIAEQLYADVPVGIFLSGGIDSSLVAAISSQIHPKIRTFSIGFDGSSVDESEKAKRIAKHLHTHHHQYMITADNLVDAITATKGVYSEPFSNPSGLPFAINCQEATKYVTVCLSGDGGDEIFGGYQQYVHSKKWGDIIEKTPLWASNIFNKMGNLDIITKEVWKRNLKYWGKGSAIDIYTSDMNYGRLSSFLRVEIYKGKMPDNVYANRHSVFNDIQDALLMDQKGCMVDCSLFRADNAGMFSSVEVRAPLLDRRILEFSWKLPNEYKFTSQIGKRVLREILYRYIPQELVNYPKQPFEVPIREWLRKGKIHEWADALLSSKYLEGIECIDIEKVHILWKKFNKDGVYNPDFWALLNLLYWIETNM